MTSGTDPKPLDGSSIINVRNNSNDDNNDNNDNNNNNNLISNVKKQKRYQKESKELGTIEHPQQHPRNVNNTSPRGININSIQ